MNIQSLLKGFVDKTIIEESQPCSSDRDRLDHSHQTSKIYQIPVKKSQSLYFKTQLKDSRGSEPSERFNCSNFSYKIHKIENELEGIERMKNDFRQKQHLRSNSSQKNILSKSKQKHSLKPSNIPKFSQPIQFSIYNSFDAKQQIKQNNHLDDKEQIIPYQAEDIFETNGFLQKSKQQYHVKSSRECSSRKTVQQSIRNCKCQQSLHEFMSNIHQKIFQLTNRINHLQKINSSLIETKSQLQRENIESKSKIQSLISQRQVLKQSQTKWSNNKLQLENLLKDVLYKKQKEKLNKQNFRKEDSENYFKNKQKSNIKETKKTNKVQNLIQKLQIKIQND